MDSREKRQEGGSEMETERFMGHDTAAEEDRPEMNGVRKGRKRSKRWQKKEDRWRKRLWRRIRQKVTERGVGIVLTKKRMGSSGGKNGSESTVDEVGSARGAFEPRREVLRRQDDGQDEGGRAQSGKRQDGGDRR